MAFDEALAQRIRGMVHPDPDVAECKMFGGIAFMADGHMFVGVIKQELLVRTGPDHYLATLQRPGVRPMDFTGKPMKSFVLVAPDTLATDAALAEWITLSREFVATLGPKKAPPPKRRGRPGF